MNNETPLSLVDQVDLLLPQTQCGRCGYAGCRPYAEAIISGETEINRCPPGGMSGVAALAALLNKSVLALDPECGEASLPLIAVIDEQLCIGCTRCIPPCPVDAIIGASKQMHTVFTEECTGCGLCVTDCPVDCIQLLPAPNAFDPDQSRRRYTAKLERLALQEKIKQERLAKQKQLLAKIKQNKLVLT